MWNVIFVASSTLMYEMCCFITVYRSIIE
jgi:hypothetical protein